MRSTYVQRSLITLLILGVIILVHNNTANTDEKGVFQKAFTVTFGVTYNALTFTEAAEKEREFRERYKDSACKVDVKVRESNSVVWRANNPNQQLHIETSGNVGIGTSTLTQSDIDWQYVTVDSTTLELIQE